MKQIMAQATDILKHYERAYAMKHGREARLNYNRDKWMVKDALETSSVSELKKIIDYYFYYKETGHSLQWLMYNFDALLVQMEAVDEDKDRRKVLRELTAARVQAYKDKNER